MENTDRRPNVLWICTDQQRHDTLGCYGNRFVNTPNLDRLAARGVKFENAYSQNPVCTPSRASFLSGRYPHVCRARQNGQNIPEDEVLVTRLLADAGYIGGLSGKLHISTCNFAVCKTKERRINDGYDYFKWSHGHGPAHEWPMHDYAIWLRSLGVKYAHPYREDSRYVRVGMPPEYHQTKWCADCAMEFMDAVHREDRPWFFSFNCFDPHHPFDPPAEYLERYLPILDEIPLPDYREGELENKSPFQLKDHEGSYGIKGRFAYDDMSDRDHRLITASYYAMIDFVDVQVGRMLEHLEKIGQADNTLVIFHSDHGESLGDHGLYLKGAYFYESGVHVPLIISCPGKLLEGAKSNALVELVDLAPTILDFCGLEPCPGMQGKSLRGLLDGTAPLDSFRANAYSEFYKTDTAGQQIQFCTMLREGSFKLTRIHTVAPSFPDNGCRGELYDLAADPGEHNNLYYDEKYAAVKLRLLEALCDREAQTADPLPVACAPW